MSAADAARAAREAYNRVHTQLDIDHELERQERIDERIAEWEWRLVDELKKQPHLADEEPCLGTCQRCGMYWDTRYYPRCPSPCGGYVG